jgi:signal transduction histidine kinase
MNNRSTCASGFDFAHLLEVAAHDLRNPISGILAASAFLFEDGGDQLPPQHISLLQSIEDSSRQLAKLVDDLLEIALLESGKAALNPTSTDLVPVVHQALGQHRQAASAKRITFSVDSSCAAPRATVDRVSLIRALERLAGNLIHSLREGSELRIRLHEDGESTVISMNAEPGSESIRDLSALFEFWRTGTGARPASTERDAAISVAKVDRIIEANGGTVQFGLSPRGAESIDVVLPRASGRRSQTRR